MLTFLNGLAIKRIDCFLPLCQHGLPTLSKPENLENGRPLHESESLAIISDFFEDSFQILGRQSGFVQMIKPVGQGLIEIVSEDGGYSSKERG